MNEGFGKDLHKKQLVKRSGAFSEPLDSGKLKSCCPHPLPTKPALTSLC